MDLHLNLNHRDLLTVRGCCQFDYMSNQSLIIICFAKKNDRTITINYLRRSAFPPNKIVEYDNSDYSDLPECYKLAIYFDYPITLNVIE